jgi:predicted transport protein
LLAGSIVDFFLLLIKDYNTIPVLGLGTDVAIHPTKMYIAFHHKQAFTGFHPSKSKLRLNFGVKISELNDPKKIARDVRHGNWSAVTITDSNEIPYALSLIK